LIDGAIISFEKAFAETEGEIVDDFGFLVREPLAVVAVRRDEAGGRGGQGVENF